MTYLIFLDLAAPGACIALGVWLRKRGWAFWRVVGVCTASYLVVANLIGKLLLGDYSVSNHVLLFTGLYVERLVEDPQPGNILFDARRVFLVMVLYPVLSLCVLPTALAWALWKLSARRHRIQAQSGLGPDRE